ncbi:MAG: flagellar biosynthetic protein FliO [Mariprofundaceae bacterium]
MQDNLLTLMLQSLASLALVLALFALFVWGMRKLQYKQVPQDAKAIKLIQRMAIDTKHSVVEIEHGDQRYLLGLSSGGMAVISALENTDTEVMVDEESIKKEAEVINVAS